MGYDFRYPKIMSSNEREQLREIKSYLHQLVDQLQWAFNDIDKNYITPTPKSLAKTESSVVAALSLGGGVDANATFNAIKGLIIKSADVVNAFYEEVSRRLEGVYVAESDFGTSTEQTSHDTLETSTSIDNLYTNIQKIVTDIEGIEYTLLETKAHTRSGLLYIDDKGIPIYGFEIGQKNTVDGVEVFNKYARFTSDRLSFYDQNDKEVAYISDYKLYITNVEITGTVKLGAFLIDTTTGFKLKYVGRG
jgi:hypothetical protein